MRILAGSVTSLAISPENNNKDEIQSRLSVLLVSSCLCYAPVMKLFVRLKSWSLVGPLVCVCSIVLHQTVTVICSMCGRQTASKFMLSTCMCYHPVSQRSTQPCNIREVGLSSRVCVTEKFRAKCPQSIHSNSPIF